ncbi:MAG: inositol monophosphatase family protein, partial [Thermoanaerobaculia bacterium]|nr:inositol monophosphatase family protein [Thermoanaerobaculia bacterium]
MYEELLEVALEAARAGSEVVERYFGDEGLEFRAKGANDFVTRADRDSERAVVEVIRRHFPEHRIVAEEGGEVGAEEGQLVWLVDPLDGTTNFMHGLPIYAVSIACVEGDRTVAAVVTEPHAGNEFTATAGGGAFWNDRPIEVSGRPRLAGAFVATGYPFRARATIDTYLAVFRSVFLEAKALRRTGAAALDLAYTAAGVFDGFFEFRLAPWDIAAGALLIEEAGGVVTDLDGGRRERS